MIGVLLGTECESGAEERNNMVDICFDVLGEATEDDMGEVGERCGTVWMVIGTLIKDYLKFLDGAFTAPRVRRR